MTRSGMARALGRLGGLARGRRLSASEKRSIAAMGARARRRSLEAERRIVANFRYAEAVQALRGPRPALKRFHTFTGRLPTLARERA
jgi:hypothetical protein